MGRGFRSCTTWTGRSTRWAEAAARHRCCAGLGVPGLSGCSYCAGPPRLLPWWGPAPQGGLVTCLQLGRPAALLAAALSRCLARPEPTPEPAVRSQLALPPAGCRWARCTASDPVQACRQVQRSAVQRRPAHCDCAHVLVRAPAAAPVKLAWPGGPGLHDTRRHSNLWACTHDCGLLPISSNSTNRLLACCRTTVDEGGETVFPNVAAEERVQGAQWSECARRGLAVKAKRGDALLFFRPVLLVLCCAVLCLAGSASHLGLCICCAAPSIGCTSAASKAELGSLLLSLGLALCQLTAASLMPARAGGGPVAAPELAAACSCLLVSRLSATC